MNNEEKILEMLTQMQADISGMKEDVSGLKGDVSGLKSIQEEQGETLMELQKAVTLTNLSIENEIKPAIKKLAEGHDLLLQKLAPKSRVEALEDEVAFLKSIVKIMGQDIAELKKAQ